MLEQTIPIYLTDFLYVIAHHTFFITNSLNNFIFSASAIGGMVFNILWSLYLKPSLIQQAWDEKLKGTTTGISPFIVLGSLMICLQAIGFFILCSNGVTLG